MVADLDADLAKAEPDVEIQELALASVGSNLGVDFLPGSLPFTPAAVDALTPEQAADLVWFDALVTNVDRTPRNPNLLGLARPRVAHRPWRGVLSPARRGAADHHGASAVSDDRRARAARRAPGRSAKPTRGWPPRLLGAVDGAVGAGP